MSNSRFTFVVEHLDPELGAWSALEYKTIAKESQQSECGFILSSVPESLLKTTDLEELSSLGAVARTESIEDYYAEKKHRICLLDPAAKQELEPADAENFDIFLFGGILGMACSTVFVKVRLTILEGMTLQEVCWDPIYIRNGSLLTQQIGQANYERKALRAGDLALYK
jgi:ribosome biogenesis SPOUT family RNA methylase Rps3